MMSDRFNDSMECESEIESDVEDNQPRDTPPEGKNPLSSDTPHVEEEVDEEEVDEEEVDGEEVDEEEVDGEEVDEEEVDEEEVDEEEVDEEEVDEDTVPSTDNATHGVGGEIVPIFNGVEKSLYRPTHDLIKSVICNLKQTRSTCCAKCRHGKLPSAARVVLSIPDQANTEDITTAKGEAGRILERYNCSCPVIDDTGAYKERQVSSLYVGLFIKVANDKKFNGPEFEFVEGSTLESKRSLPITECFNSMTKLLGTVKQTSLKMIEDNGWKLFPSDCAIVSKVMHRGGFQDCYRGNMTHADSGTESSDSLLSSMSMTGDYQVIGRSMFVGKKNDQDLLLFAFIIRPLVQDESNPKCVECFVYAPEHDNPAAKSVMLPPNTTPPQYWCKKKVQKYIRDNFVNSPTRSVYHLLMALVYMHSKPVNFDVIELLENIVNLPQREVLNHKAQMEYCSITFENENQDDNDEDIEEGGDMNNRRRISSLWGHIFNVSCNVLSNPNVASTSDIMGLYGLQQEMRAVRYAEQNPKQSKAKGDDMKKASRKIKSTWQKINQALVVMNPIISFDGRKDSDPWKIIQLESKLCIDASRDLLPSGMLAFAEAKEQLHTLIWADVWSCVQTVLDPSMHQANPDVARQAVPATKKRRRMLTAVADPPQEKHAKTERTEESFTFFQELLESVNL